MYNGSYLHEAGSHIDSSSIAGTERRHVEGFVAETRSRFASLRWLAGYLNGWQENHPILSSCRAYFEASSNRGCSSRQGWPALRSQSQIMERAVGSKSGRISGLRSGIPGSQLYFTTGPRPPKCVAVIFHGYFQSWCCCAKVASCTKYIKLKLACQ